ncbi:MAG: hypothetical protein GWN84_05270 [Gammaproteobacteria bacterium]|nr:hypothetical protein [Gammaproteobacteria bacterium]NIR82372.1 hypothetical protein [Gammaproteobacteria bacterium]NIU03517.1 hypothetical protein [Gammaproteobacteria bacterium]NIX84791.1 hypothetical protein [Gammaproteobacteria bacterium]
MAAAIIVSETVGSPTGRIVELLESADPETVRLESGSQIPGEGGVRQVVELDLGAGEEPAVGDTVDVDDEGVATLTDETVEEPDPPDFDDVDGLAPGVYPAKRLNPPSGDDCTHLLVRDDGSLGWCDASGAQSEDHHGNVSSFSVAELCSE